MKKWTFLQLIILTNFLILTNCKSDDDSGDPDSIEITIITDSPFIISVDENPMLDDVIGQLEATVTPTDSVLSYAIDSVSQSDIIAIDSESGEITVEDPSFFDYESNTEITGVFEVSSGDVSETIPFTIEILDINEPSIITITTPSPFIISVDENPMLDDIIGELEASVAPTDSVYRGQ